ncbi:MAG: hypothetical protein KAR47_12940, partial [Planctomycetes bacterium]|nr:hypothetical protein [Planctomycetota bacterium]
MAIGLLVGSCVLSAVLTAVVRRVSLRADFVARPSDDRFHKSVVPIGGGIAIFWTIAIVFLAGLAMAKFVIEPGLLGWFDESVTVHVEGFLGKANDLLIVL